MNEQEKAACQVLNVAISRRLLNSEDDRFPIHVGTVAFSLLDNLKILLGDDE